MGSGVAAQRDTNAARSSAAGAADNNVDDTADGDANRRLEIMHEAKSALKC